MSSSSIAKPLPELIDQLLAADSPSARQELITQAGEICTREVVAGIADAVNCMAREDLSRAERLAENACWLAEQYDDLFCRARIRRSAGNLQVLRGRYADAVDTFQTCIDQFTAIGERIEVAATLSSSLQPLIYLGRYSEALERGQRARDIASRHGDELLLARLDLNVGNVFHRQDRFAEALLCYKRTQGALDRLGQRRDCAIAWLNLAVVHIALNDFAKAEEAYQQARAIALAENMPSVVAQADYNVAYLYYRRGEFTKAIQLYQQTRKHCERVGDRLHSALCDLDQAEMYLDLHLNREGTQLAEQALSAFENMDMGYEAAKALVWLGIGAEQSRKPFLALDFFGKAQDRMRTQQNAKWVALLDLYRAMVLYQEGRFNEALRSCTAAAKFFSSFPNSSKAIQAHLLRANIHLALGDRREAEDCCTSAIEGATRLRSPFLLTQGCAMQGQIEEARGSPDTAINSYNEALRWLDKSPTRPIGEESKLSLSKNRLELYGSLVSLMASASQSDHSSEAIFNLVEKAKSRELVELFSFQNHSVPAPSRNHSSLAEEVKSLRDELNWYYGRVDSAEIRISDNSEQQLRDMRSRIESLEDALLKTLGELRSTDEKFFVFQSAGTIPSEKIRALLRQEEMILNFYEAQGLIYVCSFSKDAVRVAPTARIETIRDLLASLRSHFAKLDRGNDPDRFRTSNLSRVQSTLFALYRELIAPIRKNIDGRRLIIIPHGPLHYVPFHALYDGCRYLIEDHVLSYAGSASQYYLSSNQQVHYPERELLFGSFDQILKDGIEDVLRHAGVFAGATATLGMLEQHGCEARFIHVGASLQLRQDNPLFSTLTMGNTAISILDTYALQLPCSLVGLSGTGPGIDSAGRGSEIHALAQGLDYAGAQTLLMPLWNITGEPLRQFLESFYRGISSNEDRAFAFQQAVARTREKFPHPYHWASFVLRGSSRGC